ncbi:hypothetical protein C818_00806 [Lachnospiraceae bacterium MD308]|nr:hypothetical protein C818_00806 [Lachnospiraceae bacterium MD308]
MADFFEDLGKKITEVADDLGRKAGDTIETQKLKSQVRSLRRANERDYLDIGRMVYEKFQDGELFGTDFITICEAIEKRDEEIEKKETELDKFKEAKL